MLDARIDGLRPQKVHELTWEALEPILKLAESQKESPTDIFTDHGLLDEHVFYLSQATLDKATERCEIRVLTPVKGVTTTGAPFYMRALVMGNKQIVMLYDLDAPGKAGYTFRNPFYPGKSYIVQNRVTQTIRGDGDMEVTGVSVDVFAGLKILRFHKISETNIKVEVSSARFRIERPIQPIVCRDP